MEFPLLPENAVGREGRHYETIPIPACRGRRSNGLLAQESSVSTLAATASRQLILSRKEGEGLLPRPLFADHSSGAYYRVAPTICIRHLARAGRRGARFNVDHCHPVACASTPKRIWRNHDGRPGLKDRLYRAAEVVGHVYTPS